MSTRPAAIILIVSYLSGCAATLAETNPIEQRSANAIQLARGDQKKHVELAITIADWLVSCDRRHAIVWGQTTRALPIGIKPFAVVYVVDMKQLTTRESFTTTRGPFEVRIDAAGALAMIDEYVLDLPTARVRFTEAPSGFDFQPESCPEFAGRRLRSN